MQHRSRSKLWAKDTVAVVALEQSNAAPDNKFQMAKGQEEKLDGDLVGIKGEVNVLSEKAEADKPNILVHNEVVSDIDYFRSRIKKKWSDSESSDDGTDLGDSDNNDDDSSDPQNKRNHDLVEDTLEPDVSEWEAEDGSSKECGTNGSADPSSSPKNKNEEVLESGRLFICNLPHTARYVPCHSVPLPPNPNGCALAHTHTREEELNDHFSKYGTISEVHIVTDKETRRSKGIAYVLFALPESAARALQETDSSIFQGRQLHVTPAEQKNLSDMQE